MSERVCWVPVYRLSDGRTGVRPDRLYQGRDGSWEEPAPLSCPNGHIYRPGRTVVGWVACLQAGNAASGHRTHRCLECEATVYTPPVTDNCDHPTTRST